MEPVSRVSLVALRDRREGVIQQLSDAWVSDLFSVDEFEERLSRAHAAGSVAELEVLVRDLETRGASEVILTSTALVPLVITPALVTRPGRVRALFSSVQRQGSWVVAAALEISVTFGNVELDFRDARFTAPVTELNVRVLFGNLEIIVPPQLAVECEASGIFGNVEGQGTSAIADPERPLLRIGGRAVFGNIEVHTYLPGESRADWVRRQRRGGRTHGRARRDAGAARLAP